MFDRRAVLVVVASGALAGGVAWWSTAAPAEGTRRPSSGPNSPGVTPGGSLAKGAPAGTDRLEPPAANQEESLGNAEIPAAGNPGDVPELRAALQTQAALAIPYWVQISPRIADSGLREQATAMSERLRTLAEPAESLARDEYALTQALISAGGWDKRTLVALQYLNSTSAAVIQSGDPGEIAPPK